MVSKSRIAEEITLTTEEETLAEDALTIEEEAPPVVALLLRNQPAMAEERTCRELATTPIDEAPLCINYPPLRGDFELKSGLIHLLPKLYGKENEDPYKHLKAFHIVCRSMKPQGVTEEQIKLHAFPFSLEDTTKEWLFYLPSGSIDSWTEMTTMFLERFSLTSRAIAIRR